MRRPLSAPARSRPRRGAARSPRDDLESRASQSLWNDLVGLTRQTAPVAEIYDRLARRYFSALRNGARPDLDVAHAALARADRERGQHDRHCLHVSLLHSGFRTGPSDSTSKSCARDDYATTWPRKATDVRSVGVV